MQNPVQHDEAQKTFYILFEDFKAELNYVLNNENQMDMIRTYVPPEGRGQGLAGQLAQTALDYAQEHQLQVIPTCSYISVYIKKHPKYQPLLP